MPIGELTHPRNNFFAKLMSHDSVMSSISYNFKTGAN